jgi:surface polysaccharide O-acyltransferase-like enzyme
MVLPDEIGVYFSHPWIFNSVTIHALEVDRQAFPWFSLLYFFGFNRNERFQLIKMRY